tara:strand:+ start:10916 stop:12706 length:1791 start_codon:yes stop_codon:yes gene_type:complete
MDRKNLVKYTSKDFRTIRNDLEQHARIYYPDSYRDFSENTFGSYIVDTVAYVGDMLSFYLDYQVNESFLETSIEYDNVRRLANNSGYRFYGRPAAYGIASFYVVVRAATTGLGPDTTLIPLLKAGSEVKSSTGTSFVLTEDVDFSDPKNDIVASGFDASSGKPLEYAIRAFGQVKSSVTFISTNDIGSFTRFLKIRIGDSSISSVVSVVDSEGHEYFEVENLSQEVIYVNTTNPNASTDGVRNILKPKIVPRRFVVTQDSTGTYLQFGYGSDDESTTTDILDPSQVSLKMTGKPHITDFSFDPTKLIDSNTLGVAPANTTLSIIYEANESDSINISAGNLSAVSVVRIEFPSADGTTDSFQATVRGSLEVSNDKPIVGNTSLPTSEELRHRSYAAKSTQKRSVTLNDYEAFIYMMPPNLGSIKRASIVNDPSSSNRRISVYVISEDRNFNFIESNSTIKENLKVWLNKNKMLNDNIDIYDAKVMNIGFDYEIITHPTKDKISVLNEVNRKLRTILSEKMYIGEPFYLTNIFNAINKVDGVIDTIKVTPSIKTGVGYSPAPVSIQQIKSQDGTYLKAPRNVVFEIRNFNTDIRGTAV